MPKPAGDSSATGAPEYACWRKRAINTIDLGAALVDDRCEAELAAMAKAEEDALAPGAALAVNFIELQLIDGAGEPVANEVVTITDSSGRKFDAKSDAQGCVRVEGLAAGQSQVKLPERNGEEWAVEAAS